MDNKKSTLIEKIKNIIVQLVHHSKDPVHSNLSDLIAEKLNYDYTYLSNLFTESEGTTIEKYSGSVELQQCSLFLQPIQKSNRVNAFFL